MLIYQLRGVLLYDANELLARGMTSEQWQYVGSASTGVLRLVSVPMILLVIMWILAFACERREHNKLRKQLNQPVAGEAKNPR